MASETKRKLGVLAHSLRGPRWRERHRRLDLLDPVELADELLDLLRNLRPDRAARARQRIRDLDRPVVDLDVVDQTELDEVEPELGIDHIAERIGDFFNGNHRHRSL